MLRARGTWLLLDRRLKWLDREKYSRLFNSLEKARYLIYLTIRLGKIFSQSLLIIEKSYKITSQSCCAGQIQNYTYWEANCFLGFGSPRFRQCLHIFFLPQAQLLCNCAWHFWKVHKHGIYDHLSSVVRTHISHHWDWKSTLFCGLMMDRHQLL